MDPHGGYWYPYPPAGPAPKRGRRVAPAAVTLGACVLLGVVLAVVFATTGRGGGAAVSAPTTTEPRVTQTIPASAPLSVPSADDGLVAAWGVTATPVLSAVTRDLAATDATYTGDVGDYATITANGEALGQNLTAAAALAAPPAASVATVWSDLLRDGDAFSSAIVAAGQASNGAGVTSAMGNYPTVLSEDQEVVATLDSLSG